MIRHLLRGLLAVCYASAAVRFVNVSTAWLMLLLFAVVNPLLSTAMADGGVAATVPVLLTTFTNPTPADFDNFGFSVARWGMIVCLLARLRTTRARTVPEPHICSSRTARCYLFSTDGTLLTTFTNPTPADFDRFGNSVAALGSDRVLIGARADSTGATNAGTAYLFSTNGTLLTTFTRPTPMDFDQFGWSVAAMGSDRVLIGANGVAHAGAAYLFRLVPSLNIRSTTTNTLTVSWPLLSPDFTLLQNTNCLAAGNWSNVTETVQDEGTNKYIIVEPVAGSRFYRLTKP